MYTLKLPKVIGHRGACGYAPENTLASMLKAVELGVDWVEFDVMLTQDKIPIIMHDTTLNRTTSGEGKVAKTTWRDISKLDAGNGEKVPTFAELLEYLKKLKLHINIEIKPTEGKEIITAERMYVILCSHWSIEQSLPLISSAQISSLRVVYKINPILPLGYITDKWSDDLPNLLQKLHCISLHINHEELTPEKVQKIKNRNYFVLAYTVNDPLRAKELFSWGVDTVFSDFPDRIASVV